MIHPVWPAPDNVKALSTVRNVPEGQSQSPYDLFNLGDHVGDAVSDVAANRQQLTAFAKGCHEIRWLNQIHDTDCVDAYHILNGHSADASFTREHALACSVMTADCLPVLFCDLEGQQVAAAHAGWRGLSAGVLANTLRTFLSNGIAANRVIAWLGPAIAQPAFEVGPEVRDAFSQFSNSWPTKHKAMTQWADEPCFVTTHGDRLHADLYRLARLQLEYLGVAGVYGAADEQGASWCTYSDVDAQGEALFYSYRRQPQTGRQASLIWKTS